MRCSLIKKGLYWYNMSGIKNIVSEEEQNAYFEKLEMDQLRDALKRSYMERFKMMTTLMKMNIMFSRAKITHKHLSETK
jgi:hypothetical protein